MPKLPDNLNPYATGPSSSINSTTPILSTLSNWLRFFGRVITALLTATNILIGIWVLLLLVWFGESTELWPGVVSGLFGFVAGTTIAVLFWQRKMPCFLQLSVSSSVSFGLLLVGHVYSMPWRVTLIPLPNQFVGPGHFLLLISAAASCLFGAIHLLSRWSATSLARRGLLLLIILATALYVVWWLTGWSQIPR